MNTTLLRPFVCLLCVTAFAVANTQAAQHTWNNTGTDFNTAASWANGVPGAGDVALFATAEAMQPNLSASDSIAGLYFMGATSSGYDLTNGNNALLTLTGTSASGSNGTSNSSAAAIRSDITSGTNTIDAPLMLSPSTGTQSTFVQASGGTLIVNGAISSAAGVNLSLRGGGTVQLNGSNSFATASIDTSGETVVVGNNNALGAGTFTVGSTATLQAGGGPRVLANDIVFGGTTTIGGSNAFTFNGNASTSGANSRTVTVSNTGGAIFNGNFVINGNTGPGTLVVNGTSNVTMNGTISDGAMGTSVLSHSGANTLTLAHANTYSGGTTMSNGTTVSTANGAFGTGNVSLTGSNVTLTLQGVTNSIADSATLNIGVLNNSGDVVNLNYSGTETINMLVINGMVQAAGQYGAVGSGAQFENADFAGTGFVNVLAAVPEPATWMLMGVGLLLGAQRLRRKR
ncbi:MAG: PEP-CTERM sorting domain-containing protein [Chthoniobacterales bacterium]